VIGPHRESADGRADLCRRGLRPSVSRAVVRPVDVQKLRPRPPKSMCSLASCLTGSVARGAMMSHAAPTFRHVETTH
jgi:hypothetical protein